MWAKVKLACDEETKQRRFWLSWRSLTWSEWVTSWSRRRKSRLADSWSKMCVGERVGQVGKMSFFPALGSWTGSSPWDEVLVHPFAAWRIYQELIFCSRRPKCRQASTPGRDDSWPSFCNWPPTKCGGLRREALWPPRCTSSAAPRAVKMPTFGRVVVVPVSPFWQAPTMRQK